MDNRIDFFGGPSRYAAVSRPQALLVLSAGLVMASWSVSLTMFRPALPAAAPARSEPVDQTDVSLFRRIVDRVHAGESYYDAAGSEMRSSGYPTLSVFNWRLPLFAWLNGLAGPVWGQAVLSSLALATVLLTYRTVRRESGVPVAMATVALVGLALAPCVRINMCLMTELWSGTLIAFSICAYWQRWWLLGMATGLLALFFRELALPYCLVAWALAYQQKRWSETWSWVAGFLAFGIYFGFHAWAVAGHHTAADLAHPQGWVRFGGIAFMLSTVGSHLVLAELPPWSWALYLTLALIGLAGWPGEIGTRICVTVCAYLGIFAVVGQPFNNYWGLTDAPLLALGFVRSPASVRDLLGAAVRPAPVKR
jgi:hypothetical protein